MLRDKKCRYDPPGKGDHEIWHSPINNRKFPVDHDIRSRHTANAILKQAGIQRRKDSVDDWIKA
ncbi:MAG: type II toxin-antitoxin system HicA family toxin [Candidatus Binataceae bacterium]